MQCDVGMVFLGRRERVSMDEEGSTPSMSKVLPRNILGLIWVHIMLGLYGVILGCYWDNGKENGNYYLGFRVQGLVRTISYQHCLPIHAPVVIANQPDFVTSSG